MTDYPILEFDPDTSALIEPTERQPQIDIPPAAVACFFPVVIERVCETGVRRANLPSREPLWEVDYGGKPLAVFYPGQVGHSLPSFWNASSPRDVAPSSHAVGPVP